MSYWADIQHATVKASKVSSQFSRLMANIVGPTQEKRKLIMTTTLNILLYGTELWADSLKKNNMHLVLAKEYRTTALPITVISGSVLIDQLTAEKERYCMLKMKNHCQYKQSGHKERNSYTVASPLERRKSCHSHCADICTIYTFVGA